MREPDGAAAAASAIGKIQDGLEISRSDAARSMLAALTADFDGADVAWGALLGALHARGPTPAEVLGLVDAVLAFDPALADQLASPVDLSRSGHAVAITGSGKETCKTFNISTAAAMVAACHPGVCVVKPAGRATSAITGASDVLIALGAELPATIERAAAVAARTGVCLFDYHLVAPRYGPRYEGRFHHLHPLSHVTPWLFVPFRLDSLLFGIADRRTGLAASVIARAGPPHAAVVTTDLGEYGRIDEAAQFGASSITWVSRGAIRTEVTDRPVPASLSEIAQRGSHQAGAELVRDVLSGSGPPAAEKIVIVNAAIALHLTGIPRQEAESMCAGYIHSGNARRKLEQVISATIQYAP